MQITLRCPVRLVDLIVENRSGPYYPYLDPCEGRHDWQPAQRENFADSLLSPSRHTADPRSSSSLCSRASLHDKRLGCHCAPKRCHADTPGAAATWAVVEIHKQD